MTCFSLLNFRKAKYELPHIRLFCLTHYNTGGKGLGVGGQGGFVGAMAVGGGEFVGAGKPRPVLGDFVGVGPRAYP